MSDKRITVRVPKAHAELVNQMTNRDIDPYAPTITQVLLRGIELAASESPRTKRKKCTHKKPHPWRKKTVRKTS